MSKPPRPRAARRAAARAAEKDLTLRRRLAALEPGGAPERPIVVASASVVEPHALGLPCLACGAVRGRLVAHEARPAGGRVLRVVTVRCAGCAEARVLYLDASGPTVN